MQIILSTTQAGISVFQSSVGKKKKLKQNSESEILGPILKPLCVQFPHFYNALSLITLYCWEHQSSWSIKYHWRVAVDSATMHLEVAIASIRVHWNYYSILTWHSETLKSALKREKKILKWENRLLSRKNNLVCFLI